MTVHVLTHEYRCITKRASVYVLCDTGYRDRVSLCVCVIAYIPQGVLMYMYGTENIISDHLWGGGPMSSHTYSTGKTSHTHTHSVVECVCSYQLAIVLPLTVAIPTHNSNYTTVKEHTLYVDATCVVTRHG